MTTRKSRVWIGLGAFVLAAQGPTPAEASQPDEAAARAVPAPSVAAWLRLAQGTGSATVLGGDCGEDDACAGDASDGGQGGEGGEGGGTAAADPRTDDGAYLHQLGLIRGQLAVGIDLYRRGDAAGAARHMTRPGDELYAELRPALEARHAPDLSQPLERLAGTVERGAPPAEVEADYAAVAENLAQAETAAPGSQQPAVVLSAVQRLVKSAAGAYAAGVAGGRIVKLDEYQDALGFVRTAKAMVARLKEEGSANPAIVARVEEELTSLDPVWPDLVPPAQVSTDPSVLYGAAARIEIALLSAEW